LIYQKNFFSLKSCIIKHLNPGQEEGQLILRPFSFYKQFLSKHMPPPQEEPWWVNMSLSNHVHIEGKYPASHGICEDHDPDRASTS
jgi:hypothetical protein